MRHGGVAHVRETLDAIYLTLSPGTILTPSATSDRRSTTADTVSLRQIHFDPPLRPPGFICPLLPLFDPTCLRPSFQKAFFTLRMLQDHLVHP